MTDQTIRTNGTPLNGQFFAPDDCPPDAARVGGCGRPPRERKTYEREQLTNAEAAELQQAATVAEREVLAAGHAIQAANTEAVRQRANTAEHLHALDNFVASRHVAVVHALQADIQTVRRADGAEDRRRRPVWAHLSVVVVTVVAVAAYDTTFFARVFLKFVNVAPDPRSPIFYFALVPGLGLSVALLCCGHLLARAALRGRYHTERRTQRIRAGSRLRALVRRPVPAETRSARDMPWPQWWPAVVFTTVVLCTLGIWAINRARSTGGRLDTPPGAVALLLLLLSVSAIAVTVIHYNPFADHTAATKSELRGIDEQRQRLTTAAASAIVGYATALGNLRQLTAELEQRAQDHLKEAWAAILKRRDEHGQAGEVAPDFCPTGSDPAASTFAGLLEPPLALRILDGPREILAKSDLDRTWSQYRNALATLTAQTREAYDPIPVPRRGGTD